MRRLQQASTSNYQSPTAMFADISVRPVSGLTSAFESCWRIAFPRRTQWLSDSPLLVYRCGGSAGFGSLTRTRTGFPFHSPSFTICIEKAAKHLTTSPTMLTAAKAIGKLQTRADLLGRLID
jgi:hypothetical protein